MLDRVKHLLRNFHRKAWSWVLRFASNRLTPYDVAVVLDDLWWRLVKYRMMELGTSAEGIDIARMIFINNEGEAMDSRTRDMRDANRDIREGRDT